MHCAKNMMSKDDHAGQPEATRIAVDLPQDFCGAASLGLRYPDSIQAADNGAGAVPSWTCLHRSSLPQYLYTDKHCVTDVSTILPAFLRGCHAARWQT